MLDAPVRGRAKGLSELGAGRMPGGPSQRRDPVPDLREDYGPRKTAGRRAADLDPDSENALAARRARGVRLRLEGKVPRSMPARLGVSALVLAGFGGIGFGLWQARAALLHDGRLTIPSSRAVEITGNNHLTRAQLLSVFGGDVDRNLLTVPMDARRAQLESLPWVEHATVMRLLPDRVRVSIVERTPVAFVRQGSEIGLVDAHGVLLDLAPDADHGYSFPVVTGIAAQDPASTRAARMKVFAQFTSDLDAGTDKVSKRLSEVDLSDPDDVKALLPDNGNDVLVHFGDKDYLQRYERYLQNLPDWKQRYPKLSSVDMRYEHEVVLEMTPGSNVPVPEAPPMQQLLKMSAPGKKVGAAKGTPRKLVAKPVAKAAAKPVKSSVKPAWKPGRKAGAVAHPAHLQTAHDVHPKAGPR